MCMLISHNSIHTFSHYSQSNLLPVRIVFVDCGTNSIVSHPTTIPIHTSWVTILKQTKIVRGRIDGYRLWLNLTNFKSTCVASQLQ